VFSKGLWSTWRQERKKEGEREEGMEGQQSSSVFAETVSYDGAHL
jgi:hypothetical protein